MLMLPKRANHLDELSFGLQACFSRVVSLLSFGFRVGRPGEGGGGGFAACLAMVRC